MNTQPRLAAALVALTLTGCAGMQIDPMMKATHTSDITRGYPEPTTNYVGAGVTIRWRGVEVDVSHGMKARDCGMIRGISCEAESGSEISTRIYPFRRR